MRKLAVFDIDGTLHWTEVMSREVYGTVMPMFGLEPPTDETLFSTYGCTSDKILDILGIERFPDLREAFLRELEAEEVRQMPLVGKCYEGAIETLRLLRDDRVEAALCSMCPTVYMDAFADSFGIGELIRYRRDESDGSDKGKLLESLIVESSADRAVMVGDRHFDIEAARFCGVPFIGCTYGYAPDEIKGADIAVRTAKELYAAITDLMER
ncbi:MAG: HAD hydrolase-like protein [Synergistaceae bacterium]|nr:HAD hydrolase-like protein [Synergistaceae bacterium]